MPTKSIPDGYDALIPVKIVHDGAGAIQFYKDVFGATELMRMNTPNGKIGHAELKIRNSVIMVNDECPQMGFAAPPRDSKTLPASSTMIYVEKVDETLAKALEKGSKCIMPAMDMFWGDRFAKFLDPFGHLWGVATHIKDVSPEECAKAAEEWGKQQSKL